MHGEPVWLKDFPRDEKGNVKQGLYWAYDATLQMITYLQVLPSNLVMLAGDSHVITCRGIADLRELNIVTVQPIKNPHYPDLRFLE